MMSFANLQTAARTLRLPDLARLRRVLFGRARPTLSLSQHLGMLTVVVALPLIRAERTQPATKAALFDGPGIGKLARIAMKPIPELLEEPRP